MVHQQKATLYCNFAALILIKLLVQLIAMANNDTLSFITHTQFKQNSKTTGAYRLVLDGASVTLAEDTFDWEPHFRPTTVSATVRTDASDGATLSLFVWDSFGTETSAPISIVS